MGSSEYGIEQCWAEKTNFRMPALNFFGLVEAATQIRFVVFDNQTIFSSNVHQCSSWLDHYSKIAATTLAIGTTSSARGFRLAFLNRAVSFAPYLVLCSGEAQNTQIPIEES